MKKQICFIHGGSAFSSYDKYVQHLKNTPLREPVFYEGPKKRWKETLYEEFGETDDVLYLSMPNSDNAKYEEWKIWFERYFSHLNGRIIFIGHSQGGLFLAKYFSENSPDLNIVALYLVAAPFPNQELGDEDGGDFNFEESKIENITENVQNICIIHSTDDPIVPVSHGTLYKKVLKNAEYLEFNERGHFLDETFPEIIEKIREID